MEKAAVTFVVLCVLAAVPAAGSRASQGGENKDERVLAGLEETISEVNTLASDFIQEKHLEMFQEVLISRGRFYFESPDRLRWELTEPVGTGFILRGSDGRRWHDRTGHSESFTLDQMPFMRVVAAQLLAWARADFGWLRQQYRISVQHEDPVTLRLEPSSAAAEYFLSFLRVEFTSDGRHVQEVEIHERDGDFTRLRFENVVVNGPLPENIF